MALRLKLHTRPEVPLEADCICPDKLKGLTHKEISRLTLFHGNRQACLGEFFDCGGEFDGHIHITGEMDNIRHFGAAMSSGSIHIDGNVGMHTGAAMRGGEICIEGNASDWLGAEMTGGRITVRGNAGHMVGCGYRGSSVGMQGGEIIIHGNVKNETGHVMRRGLIAIGGDSGDFTGVNMLAGTIIVLGRMGIRSGAGMKRGSIICMGKTDILPTFTYSCRYHPVFMRYYYRYLKATGLIVPDVFLDGLFDRWCGDAVEFNRGEILLYKGK